MGQNRSSILEVTAWANLALLAASLVLQSAPLSAYAAVGDATGTPGPAATPSNTPSPSPSASSATAPDTAAARAQGRSDAASDGSREGNERAQVDGRRIGDGEGYRIGFERCERDARARAHEDGFQRGFGEGTIIGGQEGFSNGNNDGSTRGRNEGTAEGTKRADRDSNTAATPKGTSEGIAQANSSDATDRGTRDGTARGDAEALSQAQSVDYPQGRTDYQNARYAETPASHGEIVQKPAVAPNTKVGQMLASIAENINASVSAFMEAPVMMAAAPAISPAPTAPNPDYRYLQFKKTYPTAEENQAYTEGARAGYADSFRNAYASAFDLAYRQAADMGGRRGCDDARRRDYRDDFDRGRREGRDRGYREAYDRAYKSASFEAYRRAFGPASDAAYSANYDGFYQKHFEEARAAAYSARVNELYRAAFANARSDKYNQMYAVYAKSEYKRGQNDEAQDFAQRPIRITGIEAVETIPNGVFEPGEALRVHLQIRNFAGSEIRGQDVGVIISAQNPDQAIVTTKQEYLASNVRAKSLTEVREALEFKVNENAADRVQRFDVKLTYQGKLIDSTTLEIRPHFMITTALAETPSLKEGIAMPIRFKITNRSEKAANGVMLKLAADANILEIVQPVAQVGTLAAGESKIIEFSGIGRNLSDYQSIPLSLVATEGNSLTGRRVGVLDLTSQFPIVNDYRIDLSDAAVAALRTPGVTRVAYTIKNESRRLMYNSLQLKVRFLNAEDPSNFVVIGPNPQYLRPMEQGEKVSFSIPVLVKAANQGATIEIEVQEAGRTVVIHREDFSKGQSLN